ncbi:MAG: GNAT family N-acetyltransferase [Abitibacteriaceae bacterium]|nr:GNAT family N-acetyltransferase [Abditibacteriaceae bacterium]
MLQCAAHETTPEAVQQPVLARYATGWGRAGDMGVKALAADEAMGAAWLRLWHGHNRGFGYVADAIPELAIAVLPQYQGRGIGTALLEHLLYTARAEFKAVSLNVRADNPAVRLYERMGFRSVPGSEIINRTGGLSFNMICHLRR